MPTSCAFCDQDPCRCASPEPLRVLAPEQILRLGALTLEAERSEGLEQLLDDQEAVYRTKSTDELIGALRSRDRLLANQGRQLADGRSASRLLREFMRAALYQSEGKTKAQLVEGVLKTLGAEPADQRQLQLHGSTLGPLEAPEVVTEQLAAGTRKER